MTDPVLDLRALTKSYNRGAAGEVRVLDSASLTLARGEAVALVAPSGAGKSTLLHIAGLLDSADGGEVWLAGHEMSRLGDVDRTTARRDLVGFVYQFHHLLPEFSAAENILLPQLAAGADVGNAKARSEELLAAVGLTDRAAHRPAELSGGEQQRVAFCRALANRPMVLLADEPTGNLDPVTSDAVFDVLVSLVRETGLTALIATHNLNLAKRMDRTFRLEAGGLVEEN